MEFIRESKIDFASKRFYALGASGLLLLVGLFFMVIHHGLVYSIDFTGGTLLQYRFEQPVSDGELRTVLNEAGISAEITTLKDIQQNSTESLIKIPGEQMTGPDASKLLPNLEGVDAPKRPEAKPLDNFPTDILNE